MALYRDNATGQIVKAALHKYPMYDVVDDYLTMFGDDSKAGVIYDAQGKQGWLMGDGDWAVLYKDGGLKVILGQNIPKFEELFTPYSFPEEEVAVAQDYTDMPLGEQPDDSRVTIVDCPVCHCRGMLLGDRYAHRSFFHREYGCSIIMDWCETNESGQYVSYTCTRKAAADSINKHLQEDDDLHFWIDGKFISTPSKTAYQQSGSTPRPSRKASLDPTYVAQWIAPDREGLQLSPVNEN